MRGIDKKVSYLLEVMQGDGEDTLSTDAKVAQLSFGRLTEEDVEAIRTGKRFDPTVSQVVALADVFAVHPCYFLDRTEHSPSLHSEGMKILWDETVSTIAQKSFYLPKREKQIILNIIRQLEDVKE